MTPDDEDRFGGGAAPWIERLGNLRNVVRQELVRRQLAAHLPSHPASVIDIGAGQGTQAIELARLGHDVTAVEPNHEMRAACTAALTALDAELATRVRLVGGRLGGLGEDVGSRRFDVVCCHGVLMYLDDPVPALAELAGLVAPRGILSLVARNAGGMALRPGLRGDWQGVLEMLDAAATDRRYRNEIGVEARADDIDETIAALAANGLSTEAAYGVRLLTDGVAVDTPAPDDPAELASLLAAEEAVGRTDPYRAVATLFHLVARRRR